MPTTTWEPLGSSNCSSTNDQLVIDYLLWCTQVRNRTANTVKTYGDVLQAWVNHLGPVACSAVTTEVMEGFVTRRRGRGTRAPATQRKDVAVLRAFYRWMWERDLTETDLAKGLHSPAVHNVNPKPISDRVWADIWAMPSLSDSSRVALGLGFYCGLRRNEIYTITKGQVTPTLLTGLVRKGGGESTLPWLEMLNVHRDKLPHLIGEDNRFEWAMNNQTEGDPNDPLVGWPRPIHPDAMNKRMARWCKEAGVEHHSPHQLRHSCATNMLRAGVPLEITSRLLNHASISTTMRYVKAGGSELAEWRKGPA